MFFFYSSSGHNFLSIYIFGFLFINYDSSIIGHALQKKKAHFSMWGHRYWNTREKIWRPKMTFSEDRYLAKWSFKTSYLFGKTSSKKAHISGVKNHTSEINKYLTNLERHFKKFQLKLYWMSNADRTIRSTCKKLDICKKKVFLRLNLFWLSKKQIGLD